MATPTICWRPTTGPGVYKIAVVEKQRNKDKIFLLSSLTCKAWHFHLSGAWINPVSCASCFTIQSDNDCFLLSCIFWLIIFRISIFLLSLKDFILTYAHMFFMFTLNTRPTKPHPLAHTPTITGNVELNFIQIAIYGESPETRDFVFRKFVFQKVNNSVCKIRSSGGTCSCC